MILLECGHFPLISSISHLWLIFVSTHLLIILNNLSQKHSTIISFQWRVIWYIVQIHFRPKLRRLILFIKLAFHRVVIKLNFLMMFIFDIIYLLSFNLSLGISSSINGVLSKKDARLFEFRHIRLHLLLL